MSSFEEFSSSLGAEGPPDVAEVLKALWWARKGDWERAHQMVQEIDTDDAAWVHAHLHRQEGDLDNADYWYRRAQRARTSVTLDLEWEQMVRALLR